VDIDHFKTLNDSYGHSVGDNVICEFAGVMEEVKRASDIIARYGGDEFVAILPQADEEAARVFGERLLQGTREHAFCPDTQGLSLTISVGVATSLNPTAPGTSAALLNQADRALYMAKRAGRNRMCVWPGQTYGAEVQYEEKPEEDEEGSKEGESVSKGRIMVVDDEPGIRDVVGLMLKREDFDVVAFETAQDAINAVEQSGTGYIDLLLTDLRLPGMDGIELLQRINEIDDTIVKLVMTGYATVDNAVHSLRQGAYDFIQKPVDQRQLLAVVDRALEYRELRIENARYQVKLEDLVRERSTQLAASLEEIKRSHEFTLEAMIGLLDAREDMTGRHAMRVRELAVTLGRKMGMKGETLDSLAHGALLHDLGKIAVPDSILLKPGPLTPEEWEVMKRHPEAGYKILCSSSYLKEAAEIVRSHHERYDGSGYPRGLKGDEISLGTRVFTVIDSYEAMRSRRVYRDAVPPDEAIIELQKSSGTQFDPEVVEALTEHQEDIERVLQPETG
jgi:diguanylate cyclase (GGDEF)-like protein/putative nucleotidyltransferase with HDIG domain